MTCLAVSPGDHSTIQSDWPPPPQALLSLCSGASRALSRTSMLLHQADQLLHMPFMQT